jgi:hypothetical protein
MNWSNEPATECQRFRLRQLGYQADCPLTKGEAAYLVEVLEEHTRSTTAARGGPEIATHMAYALRLAIEHTRRAVAEAPADESERLQ